MSKLKLIYFEGCPNAKHARAVLLSAGAEFEVVKQDDQKKESPYLQYSSPTILKDEVPILGQKIAVGSSACSFENIDENELKRKILHNVQAKKGIMATIGSLGAGFTIGFCPICIPAIGAFLSSIGLGLLVQEGVLKIVFFLFIGIALFGYYWSYLKEHKNIYPFIVGTLMAVSLYVGRYIHINGLLNMILMYGGIAGIIGVSIWNWRLRKKGSCSACK